MSSLLEQAIIDANQLREAALKSAEAAVAEKYSEEIKSIMGELITEAEEELDPMEEDPLAAEGDPLAGEEEAAPEGGEGLVPPAALDGETACPCPDDVEGADGEREIEIDLDQLAGLGGEEAPQEPVEDFAAELGGEEDPLALQENKNADTEEVVEEENDADSDLDEEIELELDEDIDFTAEDLAALLEELEVNVDAGGVPSGWLGTPEPIKADQIDQNLAALKDTEEGEEKKELMKKIDELEESIKHATEEATEFKNLAENLAGKLERVNTSNAKLLYINKTLGTPSLNERQTKSIVEAISKANTAEEAKVIFETLQNSVGNSARREPLPESLSEAVNRKNSAMLISRPRRTEGSNASMDIFADRMRKLAGIKHN